MNSANRDKVEEIQANVYFFYPLLSFYCKISFLLGLKGKNAIRYRGLSRRYCTIEKQKRFYTRGTFKSIRILRLAKIPPLYHDWLRSLRKWLIILFAKKGRGVLKTFYAICLSIKICFFVIRHRGLKG